MTVLDEASGWRVRALQAEERLAAADKALDGMFWTGEPTGYAVPVAEVRAALRGDS